MDPGLNNLYNIARDEIVNLNEMIRVANEFNEGRVKRAINSYIAASRGSGHMSSAPAAARKSGGKTKNSRKKKGGSTKRRRHRK